jgi:hypothetical protein
MITLCMARLHRGTHDSSKRFPIGPAQTPQLANDFANARFRSVSDDSPYVRELGKQFPAPTDELGAQRCGVMKR